MTDDILELEKRVFILSKTYSMLNYVFAHWHDVPKIDIDKIFREFLSRAIEINNRIEFTFLMMEFFANFNNSHSLYIDMYFYDIRGKNQPFNFRPLDEKWVIINSYTLDLSLGDVIKKIDDEDFTDFFSRNKKYLAGPNERTQKYRFAQPLFVPLFPLRYTLTLNNDETIEIDRTKIPENKPTTLETEGKKINDNVAYIRIPSFDDPKFQERALSFLEEFFAVECLIIDVRGNGGGSTPSDLVKKLMNLPYRFWSESTPMSIGLFQYYNYYLRRQLELDPESKEEDSFLKRCQEFTLFDKSHLLWPADCHDPSDSCYTGKIAILTDGFTTSAAEDFVVPFKDNKRAVIIGEKTKGSTGQPFMYNFDESIRIFVGAKRAYFPDGSAFEGIGIQPDVLVKPTVADIKNKKDVVLEEALRFCDT